MPKPFTVQIASPERVCFEREVTSLVAPGYDGYLGVMANHAPMVAELLTGTLTLTTPDGEEQEVAVSGGFLSVADNRVIVLADTAEVARDIDLDRAQAAERRARERLKRLSGEKRVDAERARAALVRAVNRLTVARKRP